MLSAKSRKQNNDEELILEREKANADKIQAINYMQSKNKILL